LERCSLNKHLARNKRKSEFKQMDSQLWGA
jgi:hypothetical protein